MKNFQPETEARVVFLDVPTFKPVKNTQTTECIECKASDLEEGSNLDTAYNRVNGFQLVDTITGRFTGQQLVLSKKTLTQLDNLIAQTQPTAKGD